MIRILGFVICCALVAPAIAAPNPQLTRSVAQRLERIGIDIVPETLTTSQAAALHMMLVSTRGYVERRRKARVILTNPRYRD